MARGLGGGGGRGQVRPLDENIKFSAGSSPFRLIIRLVSGRNDVIRALVNSGRGKRSRA